MKPLLNRHPLPFLFLAFLGLLAALWAGLMRLGWQLPALTPSLAMLHGPVMISGFLGTLITLERAVAMKQRWMYLPPLLSGLGHETIMALAKSANHRMPSCFGRAKPSRICIICNMVL